MKAIGIDLGTTNSVAAVGGQDSRVLLTRAGEWVTPSVVGFVRRRKSQEGELVAGRTALNNAARDPRNTIFSVKRLMGRQYGEPRVEEVRKHYHFQVAEPPDPEAEDQGVRLLLNEQPLSPVEISSVILSQLRTDAEHALGEPVTHAVITVPAYFEERQRQATHEAGEAARLKVLRIIDEPTAAALAFGLRREKERNRVLVYDLGGGTFDVSIIQMTKGLYTVLEIAGDNWLGGDDFDRIIIDRIIQWVQNEYDFDPSQTLEFLVKARIEAEKAKIALSTQQSASILQPIYNVHPQGEVIDLDLEITREEFEEAIRPIVDRTMHLVDESLERQNLNEHDLTSVVMVGGSTAVPLVHQAVAERFGAKKVRSDVNPMQCVALGAAILASEFELDEEGVSRPSAGAGKIDGVTAMDIGISAVKGKNLDHFEPIIPKGTSYPLPEPRSRIFYPTEEDQRLIRIPIFEGLSEVASLNEQQGEIEFPLSEGISATNAVEVSFNLDDNRTLTVAVRVVGTEEFVEETVKRGRPRVRFEEATANLVDDWREDLHPSLNMARHFLQGYSTYMEPDDRRQLEEAIPRGEKALEEGNATEGQAATRTLRNKIMTSGTASQIFLAEQSMRAAAPDVQGRLAEAIAALRTAHTNRDGAEIARLSEALSTAVAQVLARSQRLQTVEDKEDFGDRLRVRD